MLEPPKHIPNHITRKERIKSLFLAMVLLAYGTFGLVIDDLLIPAKHGRGLHLHGYACQTMYIAFVMGAVNFLSVIVDHYDKRNNEINYQRFARLTRISGWIFFFIGLILGGTRTLIK